MRVRNGLWIVGLWLSLGGSSALASPSLPNEAPPELRQALTQVLGESPLNGARVGVHVLSIDSGKEIFAHNANELLNPASNMKLVTTAAALARLGPQYQFPTEFLCAQRPQNGHCPLLYIRGKGDPQLFTERIYAIAGELQRRGLRRVGDIVVDDSFFDEQREGPGWEQENTANSDRSYMAPTGALSVNHNSIAIYVSPGEAAGQKARVELEPESDFFVIDNQASTVASSSLGRLQLSSQPAGTKQRIVVSGRVPLKRQASVTYRKIDNPPLYAGETFKAIFNARGLQTKGKVRRGTVSENAVSIHTSWSRPLGDLVRELNKFSNNFMAEQLLKALGAEVKGAPGSWAKGVAATEDWLAEIGLPRGSFVMQNGSGLNDTNRFSAAQLTRLLAAIEADDSVYPEYAASLGIAGRDGTLRSRMEDTSAAGRLRGKTGTLENVTALSGYVRLKSGERWAYSIIVNDFSTRHGPAIRAVDSMAAIISGDGNPLKLVEAQPPRPPATTGELRARAATFVRLTENVDSRNLPFLRSALRTEQDPVLRAVIAEALYRADPEASLATLIESVPSSLETYTRLRAVSRELSVPIATVSALVDLAAEGHPDALDRLLALTHLLREDEEDSGRLASNLAEVGRTAPDELYEALRRAPDDLTATSLARLGAGLLGASDEKNHPFVEHLRTPGKDGTPSRAALSLLERLETLVEEARRELEARRESVEETPPTVHAAEIPGSVSMPGGG